ncbi:MAG TPA: hypothetical protein VNV42_09995 [Solirubrobacteraceae bacterium]|jgi:hypothetical protein|nr:hypothetical protein [Solirubrobacteraceae bacterium]
MNSRRLILVALTAPCISIGALVFGAAAAPAAEPPAKIDGESFSEVGSASVALSAQIDTLGTNSSYYYEYGTTEAYGSTTPTANLGAVNGDVGAPGELNGLQPDTVYHFRVVVTNEQGTVDGADVVFSTLAVGIQGLPDGRVYEMVTPPDNDNADVYLSEGQGSNTQPGSGGAPTNLPFQAAPGGDAVTYVAAETFGGRGGANQYLATRLPQGGWTQANIQPDGYLNANYRGFSSDLSVGVLESYPGSELLLPPLTPEAPGENYKVLYTRTSDGGYHALFTVTPPNRTPSEFRSASAGEGELEYMGASMNFGHVLFAANDALTANAMTLPPSPLENDLYDSVGGQLYLVNVLPDGTIAPGAAFGASVGRFADPVLDHTISSDGSRVFWTDEKTGDLYVRENDNQPESPLNESGECAVPADACTVQVDASQNPGVAGGGGSFWTASGDGSKVFFTDESRLTEDSTAAAGQPDLYEFDVESGVLSDLSIDGNAGEHANVLGVLGAGEDGEYVYFVATGSLAAGASAVEPNLYVLHGGVVKLITPLSYGDDSLETSGSTTYGVWRQSLAARTAEVAPDGRSLVFSTEYIRSGGYSASEAGGEVYHYEVENGRLVCVSCSPSVDVPRVGELPVTGASGGYLPVDRANYEYQSRWISQDGSRVFFLSDKPLVARDVNGAQDVYEWEREGSGSCRESPGCVYLLSSGTSNSSSGLLDTSASGDDAFIITRSRLVPEDEDENFNVFDARVGGAQPPVPASCSGTGCQGIPSSPPVFATPSSQTYNGVGNFSASTGPAAAPKLKIKAKSGRKAKRKRKAKGGKRRGAKARGGKARRARHKNGVGDMGRSGR